MKLLHVVPTYLPAVRYGGPVRAVHGLARSLVGRGHEVTVFTTNLHGADRLEVPTDRAVDRDGVSVRYFPVAWPRRLARSPAMGAALRISVGRFDVVHLHSLFLWPTAAAARAAERARVPWLVSPRGMLVRDLVRRRGRWRKSAWLRFVERRTLAGASRIVVTSPLEAEEARRFGLPLPPIAMLANGVDPQPEPTEPFSLPREVEELAGRGPFFVYLGRLSWKKGLETLLESLALAPEARLVLAGNDEEGISGRLDAIALRHGVRDRVRRIGFVDGDEKFALLAAARALILPSLSENFGNVVLEAWAAGTPVVVTPGVGLAAEVEDAAAGLIATPDARGLADALERLAREAELARAMGERGRRRVAERFAWPRIASQAEAIYRDVVSGPRNRPQ
jgi:glycosyltransferase involved in cell wall biosynthesis